MKSYRCLFISSELITKVNVLTHLDWSQSKVFLVDYVFDHVLSRIRYSIRFPAEKPETCRRLVAAQNLIEFEILFLSQIQIGLMEFGLYASRYLLCKFRHALMSKKLNKSSNFFTALCMLAP